MGSKRKKNELHHFSLPFSLPIKHPSHQGQKERLLRFSKNTPPLYYNVKILNIG